MSTIAAMTVAHSLLKNFAMIGFDPGPDCDVSDAVVHSSCRSWSIDPAPEVAESLVPEVESISCSFHGDPGRSFDPGPDVTESLVPAVDDSISCSFLGDPGPDDSVGDSGSEASEVSNALEPPTKRSRSTRFTASAADLAQGTAQPEKLSSYAQRALDPKRIAEVLKQVTCCEKTCKSLLSFQEVADVRAKYWHLPDSKQRFLLRYLWSLDATDVEGGEQLSEGFERRSKWHFAGKRVCFPGFCSLLGSSTRTVRARIHGSVDGRTFNVSRDKPKTQTIDRFWLEYWSSNAETLALPEKAQPTKEEGDDVIVYDDGVLVATEEYNFSSIADWAVGTSDVELWSLMGNKEGLMKLPRRFLPHGRLQDYYLEYCSWLEGSKPSTVAPLGEDDLDTVQECEPDSELELDGVQCVRGVQGVRGVKDDDGSAATASFMTFAARWAEVWRHVLQIRKSSQHNECNICFQYRQQLRSHGCLDDKLEIATKWRHHLHWQYMDRCVYWSMRWASRAKRDLLCVVIDGLDKSKFALPKYTFGRKSKELDTCHRPRVNITGAIAHGYCRGVYISDQQINTGGSFFCELLSQLIEKVSQMSEGSLPAHLVALVDNTIAQAKNVETAQFMAHLTSKFHFRSTNLFMLTEGHTHEDIGTNAATCHV